MRKEQRERNVTEMNAVARSNWDIQEKDIGKEEQLRKEKH